MDLTEARKVVWIGSNRRPLGELLDIGYLNRERLTWAVEHVNNPRVHQAAAVLLDWLTQSAQRSNTRKKAAEEAGQKTLPGLELKISIEKAREVLWPFSPHKGEPMGPLVENRILSLKDLGFAIENARESKVKAAAITLSAIRLDQIVKEPESPKGHLKIVLKGRTYSEWKQIQLSLIEGLIYGIALGIAISFVYYNLFLQEHHPTSLTFGEIVSTPMGTITLILAFCIVIGIPLAILLGVGWSTKKLDEKVEDFRKGQEGENRVSEVMNSTLNGEWTLFRDVILPGRGGDLDSVLVGPAGVWVGEIKTYSGIFRNVGEEWECLVGKRWKTIKKNPSKQARKNAARLGGFLEADHIKTWVKPAVVWANPESSLEVENPLVAVWKMDRLEDELGNIQEGSKIAENDRKRICEKLTRLIERQKN
jgi:hypothetical protein